MFREWSRRSVAVFDPSATFTIRKSGHSRISRTAREAGDNRDESVPISAPTQCPENRALPTLAAYAAGDGPLELPCDAPQLTQALLDVRKVMPC